MTAGSTTITSASANFGTDVVGNIMYVAGGTGSVTAGWYQIVSRTNATTVVVDRSTGLTSGTGVTLNIGGALKTLPAAIAVAVGSNKIFVKAESTITTTATITVNIASVTPTNSVPPTRIIGYTTTRTDAGRVSITLSTNTGLTALNVTGSGIFIENFLINCASLGTSTGISLAGIFCQARNCKVTNYTTNGIVISGINALVTDCEITGGTSAGVGALRASTTGAFFLRNFIHDNASYGIYAGGEASCVMIYNLVTNNTTSNGHGISFGSNSLIINNTCYGNGGNGIQQNASTNGPANHQIRNNLLVSNGGFGLVMASGAGTAAFPMFDGNAYFNNTSGTRSNADDTSTNPINGVSPYTNTLDVILTADPFNNAAGGDFTLNNNPGGGAACRGSATPGTLPGA